MSFHQFLLVVRARYKVILGSLFLAILIAVLANVLLTKSYKATATVLVNYKGADPVTGVSLPAQLMPGYMATQVDIISSKNVAKKVIDQLKLAESDVVKANFMEAANGQGDIRDWLADILIKKLDVKPSRESSVIDINFEGINPQFAAVVANEFAETYVRTSIELKVEPSRKAALYFTEQVKGLRNDLANAQKALSDYQQEKGIVSVDERLDVERARLNELSSQLVLAQSQTMEAQSRQRNSAGKNAFESPDIASSPIIQGLKADIARAEAKFADTAQKVEKNHPSYQGAKAEIENLKAELNRQIYSASSNVASNSRILQQRENEIRATLAAQKSRVLELNRDRDALAILTREVENAQKAYDIATQRYTETNIEGQSNQADITILNPAVPPIESSSPKVVLNLILAVVLGLITGVGLALALETLNKPVRVADDLVQVLRVPVLGVLERDKFGRRSKKYFPQLAKSSSLLK